jgi:tetratricopeptide (TPR) repeat protein
MRDNIDSYSPCPCGSGKKYRFCCQRKNKTTPARQSSALPPIIISDMEKNERLHSKGMRYMQLGKFEQAIPCFAKIAKLEKISSSPANNLALCLFLTGKQDEAIRVQRQNLENSLLPNPFGVANLSMFLMILGDEAGAEKAVSHAATLKAINPDATAKVCEMLARLRRHQDIITTADASDFGKDPNVLFYTGVAAANLGDYTRAIEDLRRVPYEHVKASMTQQYLQHLESKTQPNTIRKDWPYLLPSEFYIINNQGKRDDAMKEALLTGRYMVDFVEVALNTGQDGAADGLIEMLRLSRHPEAIALLRLIMEGNFGSDQLRINAAKILTRKGEIKKGEEFEILHKGKPSKQQVFSINLNSDFVFGEIPPAIEKQYRNLVMAGRKPSANWREISLGYEKLSREAPQYYPVHYNYAVSLVHIKRSTEAESILRRIVDEHPAYLFARATLLTILAADGRLTEAKNLVAATNFPDETHPGAYIAWLVAMTQYHEELGQNAAAFATIKAAHELAPDDPNAKMLWRDWQDYDEEKDTSSYLMLKRAYKKFSKKLSKKFNKK